MVLEQDLASSQNIVASVVNDESGAYQYEATGVVRTTIEDRQGRITVQAAVTDLTTQKNREVLRVDQASSAGFISVLNGLAKHLDGRAIDFSTTSDRALQVFASAFESNDLQSRMQRLGNAIAVDPGFGLAYLVLAETMAQAGPQNVVAVLEKARPHEGAFTPYDRARFETLLAQVSHAPLAEQAKAQSAILQVAPNNATAQAALGSIRFLQNDSTDSRRLYQSALRLNPTNANMRRAFGDGLLETRQFGDAEKLFTKIDNNPAVLPDLAACILLEGDAPRANTVFDKFMASRAPNDPLNPLLRAQWLAVSGQVPNAIEALQRDNFADPGIRSLALTQLTIWQLYSGDFKGAISSAKDAVRGDPRPTSFANLAALLAAAPVAKEKWHSQVDASPLSPQVKESVLGYGLFFTGNYQDAAQLFQRAIEESGNSDLRARAMLAASLDRAGEHDQASKVTVQPFVPELGDLYSAVSFNEMHRLLGVRVK